MFAPQWIVCSPVAHGPTHVAGAIEGVCTGCGKGVFVSPASMPHMKTCALICIICAFEILPAGNAPVIPIVTEAQREEIAETLGRDVSKAEVEGFRAKFERAMNARKRKP